MWLQSGHKHKLRFGVVAVIASKAKQALTGRRASMSAGMQNRTEERAAAKLLAGYSAAACFRRVLAL